MREYSELLEEETFKSGESAGRLKTAMTVMTDMLIELNSLEIYYQKPTPKTVTPPQLAELRQKVAYVKSLLHEAIKS